VAAGTLALVVSITANSSSFCAVLSTGKVDCWGNNNYGELGNGTTTDSDVPVAVTGITSAKALASASDGGGFCALLSTGKVDCWGYDDFGELGNGTTTNSDVPVAVKGISAAATVISGDYAFCARLSTSHLDCWGNNEFGQLGNAATADSDVPVAVKGITDAKSVTGDSVFGSICAVLKAGKVDCWGYNASGQLGNGTKADSDVPVAAEGVTGATAVAADIDGGGFCARLSTRHLDCWGDNSDGQLGNRTTTNSDVPVAVKTITTATAVIGGYYGYCALLSTRHLDCWGDNLEGELGNGSMANSDVPVAVRTIANGAAMAAGAYYFCALLSTSHVDCWGNNEFGQLGNGTVANSDVPVKVHSAR
jgi:alpha-tubulin suppressor-like RCC1 family protein